MRLHFLLALAALAVFSIGCDTAPQKAAGGNDSHSHEDGHDHGDEGHADHDHDHPAHGPNGGHIFAIDSEDYQGEWCKFKDNNVIKMHILDKEGEPALVKVDSFKVIPSAGSDQTPFELAAESPDEEGKSSVYSLDDQSLGIAIPLGVDIEIAIGDTVLKGKIESHEPRDH